MKFNYQARTKEGEIQTGVVEASSKEAALSLLEKHGFYITYLEEAKPPFYARKVKIFTKISLRDIVLFSRQLSIMFGSKVPLVEALRVLTSQAESSELREKISSLSEEVEGGSPFSKALSRHPRIFSPLYVSMVKAGEASGRLSESLNYLAEHLEREYHLSAKIKGALIYPFLVLSVVLLVLYLMVFLVIPSLTLIIREATVEIPKVTQIVIKASEFLREFGSFLIVGFFIITIYHYTLIPH